VEEEQAVTMNGQTDSANLYSKYTWFFGVHRHSTSLYVLCSLAQCDLDDDASCNALLRL